MLQANAKRGDKKVEDWVSKDCELLFDEFGGQDCRGVHMYALHDSMGGNDSEDGRASSSTPGNGEEIASMEDGKLGGKAESLGLVTFLPILNAWITALILKVAYICMPLVIPIEFWIKDLLSIFTPIIIHF